MIDWFSEPPWLQATVKVSWAPVKVTGSRGLPPLKWKPLSIHPPGATATSPSIDPVTVIGAAEAWVVTPVTMSVETTGTKRMVAAEAM